MHAELPTIEARDDVPATSETHHDRIRSLARRAHSGRGPWPARETCETLVHET